MSPEERERRFRKLYAQVDDDLFAAMDSVAEANYDFAIQHAHHAIESLRALIREKDEDSHSR
jgi:septation ring formation regulator EzrA